MRLRQAQQEDLWVGLRRRMLAETNAFLSLGMRRPELAISIPIIPADRARFTRTFAEAFWRQVLADA